MRKTWIAACATGAMLTLMVPMAAFGQQRDGGGGAPPPPPPGVPGNMVQPPDDGGRPDMPPPPGGGQGGPRGMPGGGGPRDQGQPWQGGGRDQMGQGAPGGFGPGARMMQTPFDNQRAYLDLVDRFTRLSHDPETAGVAAVIKANELMRPKGAEATIAYFTKILPEARSEAVRRAIRLHLIDLYQTSGQGDKALAEVEQLIKGAPEK